MWGLGHRMVRVGLGLVSWGWLCWPGVAVRGWWLGVRDRWVGGSGGGFGVWGLGHRFVLVGLGVGALGLINVGLCLWVWGW